MDDPVQALADQQAELAALVDDRDDDGLSAASACAGWSVADVLLHLAQTNEAAVASLAGDLAAFAPAPEAVAAGAEDVDAFAAAMVEAERGPSPSALRDRWRASADAQVAAFRTVDPAARVTWVVGELAARTLASTRLSETWIHTLDVAAAYGAPPAPSDRLWHVARLAWRTLPYAFARAGRELAGPVAFELTAPDGSPWTFHPDGPAATVVEGPALDLCRVAGQRADAADTALQARGADADAVLTLVRTFA